MIPIFDTIHVREALLRDESEIRILHDFSLLPEAQGKGVGTALLVELERRGRVRGCRKLTLEVHDSNEGAKRLYARFGLEGWVPPTFFVAKPL